MLTPLINDSSNPSHRISRDNRRQTFAQHTGRTRGRHWDTCPCRSISFPIWCLSSQHVSHALSYYSSRGSRKLLLRLIEQSSIEFNVLRIQRLNLGPIVLTELSLESSKLYYKCIFGNIEWKEIAVGTVFLGFIDIKSIGTKWWQLPLYAYSLVFNHVLNIYSYLYKMNI